MKQNARNHLSSVVIGVGFGIGAFFVAAVAAAGITFAVAAGALTATPVGILSAAVAVGAASVVTATAVHCFWVKDDMSFKPVSAFIGGLVALAAGIGLIFAADRRAFKSIMRSAPQTESPVENTRRLSFLDHKNDFSIAARNDKKALVLLMDKGYVVPRNSFI